ncbi:hypothetical protein Tsubulata_006450, partial [Turnera subulata]
MGDSRFKVRICDNRETEFMELEEEETIEARNTTNEARNTTITKQKYMPVKFAKKYLSGAGDKQKILIQGSHGRKWLLGFTHKTEQYPTYFIHFGREGFVDDNDLEEGDVLHFELVDRKNPTLKVNIFHAGDFSG